MEKKVTKELKKEELRDRSWQRKKLKWKARQQIKKNRNERI